MDAADEIGTLTDLLVQFVYSFCPLIQISRRRGIVWHFFKGVSNQTNALLLRGSSLNNALATDLALNGLRMQSRYLASRPH